MHIIGDGGHAKVVRNAYWSSQRPIAPSAYFVAVGDNEARKRLAEANNSVEWATIIHKAAQVAYGTEIGEGTIICAGAIIDPAVKIGRHCIINAGAIVTHDCVIGDYAHIAPGVALCGGVHVGEGALVGVGVGIEPGVEVPAWSTVKRVPYAVTIQRNG